VLERELQKGVLDVARILGYRCHHTRPAWTSKGYRTPISGNIGFPDLVLVGHGRLLIRELKVGKNVLSAEQSAWICALEEAVADVGVWTETDWEAGLIEADLRRGTKHDVEAVA